MSLPVLMQSRRDPGTREVGWVCTGVWSAACGVRNQVASAGHMAAPAAYVMLHNCQKTKRALQFSSLSSVCVLPTSTGLCSTSDANNVFASELAAQGVAARQLPSNREAALAALLEEVSPDVVMFDRFLTEEMFSFRVRQLRPSALHVLDMQDLHSLRRHRQALVAAGVPPAAMRASLPDATDTDTLRELSSIHRSDLALVCSPEEYRRLTRHYGVQPQKLALASFFIPPSSPTPSSQPASFSQPASSSQPGFSSQPASPSHPPPPSPAPLPTFSERSHICHIGNFRHAPNLDCAAWLAGPIWDSLRPLLPPGTECHLWGSYATGGAARSLHAPKRGVRLMGQAPDVGVLARYRLLLAPLRYGAGIKGKVLDAWEQGTPVVTTPVGAEGLHAPADAPWLCDYAAAAADGSPAGDWAGLPLPDWPLGHRSDEAGAGMDAAAAWGGDWRCEDEAAMVEAAATLYADESRWTAAQEAGRRALSFLFPEAAGLAAVRAALERAAASRDQARAADLVGGMLWHHGARSTEFFARFIEAKEALAAVQQQMQEHQPEQQLPEPPAVAPVMQQRVEP